MACAGRQHQHIARNHAQGLPSFPTKHHLGPPTDDTQCFVGIGVKVMEIVDAGAPDRRPAVRREQRFEPAGNILRRFDMHVVQQDRKTVVRCSAVILEVQGPHGGRGSVDGLHGPLPRQVVGSVANPLPIEWFHSENLREHA